MQESRFNLATHEPILEAIVDDIACGGLHSEDTHINFFICAAAFARRLGDAK